MVEAKVSTPAIEVGAFGHNLGRICHFGGDLYLAQEFIRIGSYAHINERRALLTKEAWLQ